MTEWPLNVCLDRTQFAEVRGRSGSFAQAAQQHAAQELRLPAGEEKQRGQDAQTTCGEHTRDGDEQTAGETHRGRPARGHQGKSLYHGTTEFSKGTD